MLADSAWVSVSIAVVAGLLALLGVGWGAWLSARSTRDERRQTMSLNACGELLASAAQFAATLARLRECSSERGEKFDRTKYYFGEEIPRVRIAIEKVRLLTPDAVAAVAAEMSDIIDEQIEPLHVRLDDGKPLSPTDLQAWDSLCEDFRPVIARLRDASRSSLTK